MLTQIVDWIIVAGTALLSVRLYVSGLSQKYRTFFYYLIFFTVQTGFMMRLDPGSGAYLNTYVFTEPISLIFYVLLVLELYSLVLADYRGLYTAGRLALIIAVTVALLASALTLLAPSHVYRQSRTLTYYFVAERAVYLSLVVFLLTILLVLLRYPITLKRNIVVHSVVFSVYFLCNTALVAVLSLKGFDAVQVVKFTLLAFTLGSLVAWLLLLTPAGEKREVHAHSTSPNDEEQLVSQLKNLNQALLRSRRK